MPSMSFGILYWFEPLVDWFIIALLCTYAYLMYVTAVKYWSYWIPEVVIGSVAYARSMIDALHLTGFHATHIPAGMGFALALRQGERLTIKTGEVETIYKAALGFFLLMLRPLRRDLYCHALHGEPAYFGRRRDAADFLADEDLAKHEMLPRIRAGWRLYSLVPIREKTTLIIPHATPYQGVTIKVSDIKIPKRQSFPAHHISGGPPADVNGIYLLDGSPDALPPQFTYPFITGDNIRIPTTWPITSELIENPPTTFPAPIYEEVRRIMEKIGVDITWAQQLFDRISADCAGKGSLYSRVTCACPGGPEEIRETADPEYLVYISAIAPPFVTAIASTIIYDMLNLLGSIQTVLGETLEEALISITYLISKTAARIEREESFNQAMKLISQALEMISRLLNLAGKAEDAAKSLLEWIRQLFPSWRDFMDVLDRIVSELRSLMRELASEIGARLRQLLSDLINRLLDLRSLIQRALDILRNVIDPIQRITDLLKKLIEALKDLENRLNLLQKALERAADLTQEVLNRVLETLRNLLDVLNRMFDPLNKLTDVLRRLFQAVEELFRMLDPMSKLEEMLQDLIQRLLERALSGLEQQIQTIRQLVGELIERVVEKVLDPLTDIVQQLFDLGDAIEYFIELAWNIANRISEMIKEVRSTSDWIKYVRSRVREFMEWARQRYRGGL